MAELDSEPPDLADLDLLIEAQAGMVARRQLHLFEIDADRVRNQIRANRWVARTPLVVSTTTGVLTVEQWRWLGVLHAGAGAMLGGLTALDQQGLRHWHRPEVTVIAAAPSHFDAVARLDIFRTRRALDPIAATRSGIPTARVEPAAVLHAAYRAHTVREAQGLLAAVVQQGLSSAERLDEWVARMRPLRRGSALRAALRDIGAGAHSGAELDVARMCRRFGMPMPTRQRQRVDRAGKTRWTDAEWELADGSVAVLEVDGGFHTEVRQWQDDLVRQRKLTTRTRVLVRCSAYEIRHEPEAVAIDLIALGVPGRVPQDAA